MTIPSRPSAAGASSSHGRASAKVLPALDLEELVAEGSHSFVLYPNEHDVVEEELTDVGHPGVAWKSSQELSNQVTASDTSITPVVLDDRTASSHELNVKDLRSETARNASEPVKIGNRLPLRSPPRRSKPGKVKLRGIARSALVLRGLLKLTNTPAKTETAPVRRSPSKRRRKKSSRRHSIAVNTSDQEVAPIAEERQTSQASPSKQGEHTLGRTNTFDRVEQFQSQVSTVARPTASPPKKGIQYASTIQRLEREIAKQQHRELTPADAHRRLLLLPTSQFWTFWNSLHLCALSYICTCVPYMTALTPPTVATMIDWGDYVNRIIDVFYVLDIVVSFRAAYVHAETGELVYDSRQIARNYVHGWFFFDLAMAFPFDVLLPDSVSSSNLPFFVRILRLIRLAKLMRILKVQPLLDYCEDFLGISRNKLVVLQLVLSIFLVAHLTACGFILAATADHFFQEPFALASKQEAIAAAASSSASSSSVAQTPVTYASWIYVNDLTDAPARDIYITALYWSFTMMTTVGFGDIVPVTIVERMYTIFAMVISAGTYAYVIASMSSIVALMNLSQSRYYERINELNAYMESRQLPPGLQLRTRQFYRYYLTKKTVFDETALFDALPTNLREELVEHFIKTVIRHIAFFQDIEKAFTAHIALLLKPVFFSPQSMVIKEQDVGTEMFIISKGELQVLFLVHDDKADNKNSSEERNVAVLQDGDHFGELALLCDPAGRRRQASVRALTYCELHTLSYAHLDGGSTLERFPLVRKKLVDTASQRMALLNNLHKAKLDSLLPHHHNTTGAHGHTGMIAMLQSQLNQNIGHHLHHHHHGHHRHDGGHGQRDDEQQPAERGRGVNIFAAEIKRLSQVELALFTPSTDSTRVPHSLSSTSSSWLSSAHLLRPSSNSCTSRRQLPIDAEAFPAEQTHL